MTSISVHSIPASLSHPGTNKALVTLALLRVHWSPALERPISEVRHDATFSPQQVQLKAPSPLQPLYMTQLSYSMCCGGPFSVYGSVLAPSVRGVLDGEGPQWGSAQTGERLEWWGWPNEGWMGVGVGSMCPEWLKGGRWPMWAMWLVRPGAPPKGEDLSCMHLDSSSKPSPARLFLLDLLDILRLRVWIPSFFMVRGLLTCGEQSISLRQKFLWPH